MKKYPWFKHWNDDSHNLGLVQLWDEHNLEAVAIYFKLCQIVSRYEQHDARGQLVLSWATYCRETRTKPPRSSRLLSDCVRVGLVRCSDANETQFKLEIVNWLKSQEVRDSKNIHKTRIKHSRGEKREERGEKIEDRGESALSALVGPSLFSGLTPIGISLLAKVKKEESIKAWGAAYNESFLKQEINKAAQYCVDKNKSYSNVAGFLSNWFERSNSLTKHNNQTQAQAPAKGLPPLDPTNPDDFGPDPFDRLREMQSRKGNG